MITRRNATSGTGRSRAARVALTVVLALAGVEFAGAVPEHGVAGQPAGVVGWGSNFGGEASPPAGLVGVTQVAAGWGHGGSYSLALKADGTVAGWGGFDQIEAAHPPAGLNGVTSIAAGEFSALALRVDGTVVSWGSRFATVQPPAGLSGVTAISSQLQYYLALNSDGTVVDWAPGLNTPTDASALRDVTAIAAGGGCYRSRRQLRLRPRAAGK